MRECINERHSPCLLPFFSRKQPTNEILNTAQIKKEMDVCTHDITSYPSKAFIFLYMILYEALLYFEV